MVNQIDFCRERVDTDNFISLARQPADTVPT